MTNIYVGWIGLDDPPSPWTRLTRRGKYIRTVDDFGEHLVATGSTTHSHAGAPYSWSCGNNTTLSLYDPVLSSGSSMNAHNHSAPVSVTSASSANNPPYYGIDIIYMDADTWQTTQRCFPVGVLLLSYSSITDDSLTRHSDSDNKMLYNTTPGTTGGSSSTHTHTISGTTMSSGTSGTSRDSYYKTAGIVAISHTHTFSATSSSKYQVPAYIKTRLYEVTEQVDRAVKYTVAFFSGTPPSEWTILTGWANRLIMGGNTSPTTGGSDTHTHTISCTSSSYSNSAIFGAGESDYYGTNTSHTHSISATVSYASNVPSSIQMVPAYLTVTLMKYSCMSPQIIGLSAC